MHLRAHLACNNINTNFQCAYKQFHCIETTLLRVLNDLLTGMNDHEVSILLLLDLSSAFDTLNHDILINRLHDYAGVGEIALQWFSSNLQERTPKVKIRNVCFHVCFTYFGEFHKARC